MAKAVNIPASTIAFIQRQAVYATSLWHATGVCTLLFISINASIFDERTPPTLFVEEDETPHIPAVQDYTSPNSPNLDATQNDPELPRAGQIDVMKNSTGDCNVASSQTLQQNAMLETYSEIVAMDAETIDLQQQTIQSQQRIIRSQREMIRKLQSLLEAQEASEGQREELI